MPFFRHEGSRLAYTIYGDGPRTFVLVHGLLLSQKMHRPLASALAARGNRVVTLDLLGHGRSDRPQDMTRYSMPFFGEQMIALLDHLEVDEAVLGGTSLGANATLEAAVRAPERVRGMVVEMPVLDNALLGCAIAFTPLMVALTFGEPVMRLVARGARMVPSGVGPLLADVSLDTIRQDPGPAPPSCTACSSAHGAAQGAAPRDRRAGPRHRPRARSGPPLQRLRRAGRRAAQRPPRAGQLDPRAASSAPSG